LFGVLVVSTEFDGAICNELKNFFGFLFGLSQGEAMEVRDSGLLQV